MACTAWRIDLAGVDLFGLRVERRARGGGGNHLVIVYGDRHWLTALVRRRSDLVGPCFDTGEVREDGKEFVASAAAQGIAFT